MTPTEPVQGESGFRREVNEAEKCFEPFALMWNALLPVRISYLEPLTQVLEEGQPI